MLKTSSEKSAGIIFQLENGKVPVEKVEELTEDVDTVGKGKRVLLVFFFIFAAAFIFFLPELSEIINMNKTSSTNEVQNGILKCSMESVGDVTNIEYNYAFAFKKRKLVTSEFETVYESEDSSVINEKYTSCNNINTIAQSISGIDVSCTNSANITTMIQSITYNIIDRDSLTNFTEAGGEYPEFVYQDNISEIESKMIKSGYDCKITAN